MQAETTGTDLVDSLIDGVHIGDNLVMQGGPDAPLRLLVDRFVAATRGRVPLVLVNADRPFDGEMPDGVEVLDWSPASTGTPSTLPGALAADATFAAAVASLEAADERAGTGAAFVVDGLSGVQKAWGRDAALELFLTTCPRLYRRRSLAVWPLRTDHHRPTFLRRLTEITQVVVEFTDDRDGSRLTVRKATGRDEAVVGRSVTVEVVDDDLRATGTPSATRELLGTAIRDQRLGRGLSQAEVARRVGITPSALSQVERGVRGPGGDTLVRLWEVLGVPFGPGQDRESGFTIARRSGRERRALQDGLTGEQLLDDPVTGEVWHLEFAPGGAGASGPFAVKAPESVLVVRGVLDLTLDGRVETLHEGDALVAATATVTAWANPAAAATEAVWTVHRARPGRRQKG
ncbi:MAG TPA: helix-turn-helix domain-containing protein [Egicoccus sp.]|nr:helix-turn-helix domain-containing protein [Egicoccus sp.]HSK23396.1 helix-turn-helix domain-containing protein [Egicoccus sp.]